MAHSRETFPILEDVATGYGETLAKMLQGDTPTAKNGLLAFTFKDSAGNVVLPTLTPEGKVPVDFEGAGVSKRASSDGEIVGSLTDTVIAEIALTADKTYGRIAAKGHCFKEAIFYLVKQDDTNEEIIGHGIVGPGQYDTDIDMKISEIVAGSAGTQKLILKAKNLNKVSDLMGSVCCLEFAV